MALVLKNGKHCQLLIKMLVSQECTWLMGHFQEKSLNFQSYDCKRTIKWSKNNAFCNVCKLLLSYNSCDNHNLTLNCKSDIHHQECQNQQNWRRRRKTHSQAHLAESGGGLFFGCIRVLFLSQLFKLVSYVSRRITSLREYIVFNWIFTGQVKITLKVPGFKKFLKFWHDLSKNRTYRARLNCQTGP